MKNKKAKPLSDFKYIPPELLTQIFTALPVKTLVRFRSVCKSWCSIIDDPDFVLLHLNLYKNKNNSSSKNLLALEGLGGIGTAGCLLTLRQGNTLEESAHIFRSSHRYYLLGECNGLLLIQRAKQLRLWNPSIRKSLAIPRCPVSNARSRRVRYLFGFANCSQDYKIIAISFTIQDQGRRIMPVRNMRVAVYTLNDQQWTVRDNHHDLNITCCYFTHRLRNCHQKRITQALVFRGASYWVGTNPHYTGTCKPSHLLSFDFDLEKFSFFEFPFGLEDEQERRFVFRLGDSLAIFNVSSENASIWMMKQESGKDVWIQWFTRRSCKEVFQLFAGRNRKPVFYNESDIGRCLVLEKFLYNVDSGQAELINSKMSPYLDLETYSESLVLCRGYGAKDLTSFP